MPPISQSFIATALAVALSAPSFAGYTSTASDVSGISATYGSMSHQYQTGLSDNAPSWWSAPMSEREARLKAVRDLLAYSGVKVEDLRTAAVIASTYFSDKATEPPQKFRLVANQDPENGRGYLRLEIPVHAGTSDELADMDFELSMKVATALISGTEQLVVSVVRA